MTCLLLSLLPPACQQEHCTLCVTTAGRARGRLSGYHPNGFLHGYKQPNYRPGPHINTILRTQAQDSAARRLVYVCESACVRAT